MKSVSVFFRRGVQTGKTVFCVLLLSALVFSMNPVDSMAASDGTYSGTFSGDDYGYWVAIVSGSSIKFISWSTRHGYIDYADYLYISGDGDFSGTTDYNYTNMSGSINSSGSVSGTYSNSSSGDSGTLTGQLNGSISEYVGSYSGSYSGDDSGTWSMTVSSSGAVSGTINSSMGTISVEGGVSSDGRVIAGSDEGDGVYGTFSGGSVSGSWVNPYTGSSGSFSSSGGSSGGSGSDGDGDGGGGGCFMQNLLWK